MAAGTLTAIDGLRVGHWTDAAGGTGCTVVLMPREGCVASASFLGPSPGTREGVLLAAEKSVERIHAVLLTGGSAFGLAAADGVVRWLAERGIGHPTRTVPVPIVPAAVVYDLLVGDPRSWPDAAAGYAAAAAATSDPVAQGRVGAGTGATAGKYLAPVPTGLGSALVERRGVRVGALAVVNPVGDVHAPDGTLVAGHGELDRFVESGFAIDNTTLVVVAVEAPLVKAAARQLADTAQGALGRVIRPSHTPWDGDAVFVVSTGRGPAAPLPVLGALAQDAVSAAVVNGARLA